MNENILVCSYNYFPNLAHKPHGKENKIPLRIINYSINKLIDVKDSYNPAFVLKHPDKNIVYICCESIYEGDIMTLSYDSNFNFTLLDIVKSGKSTCYLELDLKKNNLISINYWDSTIKIHPLKNFIAQKCSYTVNSKIINSNRVNHLKDRQKESHNHSILLYTHHNKDIAFVPDLGKDVIRIFELQNNYLKSLNKLKLKKGSGPRYIRNKDNYLYVINELSSTIDVIKIDTTCFKFIDLKIVQKISTIPKNFEQKNTCGNIAIHPSNNFIFASNRGHDSIAVFEILEDYKLKLINIIYCMGKTPRHFTINKNGSVLYVANQDSDNVSIFKFENKSLIYDNDIKVDSPNFIIEL
tara:strand:+ start:7438 stop:8499 length:1062 start_codon:yes stop_codon:yes gene_type:complete